MARLPAAQLRRANEQWSFFKAAFTERVGRLVSYQELADGEDLLGARTLATTTFASTLAIVSGVLELGLEDQAMEIKRPFMSGLPPPGESKEKTGA